MKVLFGIGAANERLAALLEVPSILRKTILIFTSKRVFAAALNAAKLFPEIAERARRQEKLMGVLR